MDVFIAGAGTGLLLASFWITLFCLALFKLYGSKHPFALALLGRHSPSKIIFPFILLINPTCAGLGAVFAFLFVIIEKSSPGNGLGSPNLIYTGLVLLITSMVALPVLILGRIMWRLYVWALASFALSFGWLIPYFAV